MSRHENYALEVSKARCVMSCCPEASSRRVRSLSKEGFLPPGSAAFDATLPNS